MNSFYTCGTITDPARLVRAGATPIELSYTYQVNTPLITNLDGSTSDSVADALERVQSVILEGVAERSGLTDCVVASAKGKKDGNDWRGLRADGDGERGRRVLTPKGRGATSIMAISLDPTDQVDENAQCLADTSNSLSRSSFWSEVDESATTGSVEDESTSNQAANELLVNDESLVDVRIDGKMGIRANTLVETRSNVDAEGQSFNFISTQSVPIARSSFAKDHDPLVPSDLISPRMTTKCTVVQGHMTLYTYDSTDYENLEARVIDAIKEDMEDATYVKEKFLNDAVLGVKFIGVTSSDVDSGSTVVQDPINSSPGYVSSIMGSPSAASSTGTKMDVFTFPVMILIALGTIMFVLLALFVGTNRKRKRYDDDSYYQETYYDKSSYRSKEIHSQGSGSNGGLEVCITETRLEYKVEEHQQPYLYSSAIPSLEDIGRSLSGVLSVFSDQAVDKGRVDNRVDPSVYETYETTLNCNGGVHIQEVRSFGAEDFEDCYSIHSIRAADDDETEVPDTDSLASQNNLRNPKTPPGSPGRSGNKSPRKSYPSLSRVTLSPKRTASRLLERFTRNREDDDESLMMDAYLSDDNLIDETEGMEVTLQPFWSRCV